MISLADYLTEFPEESDRPFQSLKTAKPAAQKKPSFEHLTLVADGLPVKKRPARKVPEHLEAIPEIGDEAKALESVEFDAADFGFDAAPIGEEAEPAFPMFPQVTEEDVEAARAEGREDGRLEALAEIEQRVEGVCDRFE